MIEAPAGLIDPNETSEECAIRELKEETGYIGKATGMSPMMFNGMLLFRSNSCSCSTLANGWLIMAGGFVSIDPGLSNSCLNAVYVDVDMSLPENQNPRPELEDAEFIETFTVPIRDLSSTLKQLETEGFGIDVRVGTIAEGIEIAKWGLFGGSP